MRNLRLIVVLIFLFLIIGCAFNRGDLKAIPVFEGDDAPFDGLNIGYGLFIRKGQKIKQTGSLIWWKGMTADEFITINHL